MKFLNNNKWKTKSTFAKVVLLGVLVILYSIFLFVIINPNLLDIIVNLNNKPDNNCEVINIEYNGKSRIGTRYLFPDYFNGVYIGMPIEFFEMIYPNSIEMEFYSTGIDSDTIPVPVSSIEYKDKKSGDLSRSWFFFSDCDTSDCKYSLSYVESTGSMGEEKEKTAGTIRDKITHINLLTKTAPRKGLWIEEFDSKSEGGTLNKYYFPAIVWVFDFGAVIIMFPCEGEECNFNHWWFAVYDVYSFWNKKGDFLGGREAPRHGYWMKDENEIEKYFKTQLISGITKEIDLNNYFFGKNENIENEK